MQANEEDQERTDPEPVVETWSEERTGIATPNARRRTKTHTMIATQQAAVRRGYVTCFWA